MLRAERVGEQQAALGVGVRDLDRGAVQRAHDVAGLEGAPAAGLRLTVHGDRTALDEQLGVTAGGGGAGKLQERA